MHRLFSKCLKINHKIIKNEREITWMIFVQPSLMFVDRQSVFSHTLSGCLKLGRHNRLWTPFNSIHPKPASTWRCRRARAKPYHPLHRWRSDSLRGARHRENCARFRARLVLQPGSLGGANEPLCIPLYGGGHRSRRTSRSVPLKRSASMIAISRKGSRGSRRQR